jgi:hypothetical protein
MFLGCVSLTTANMPLLQVIDGKFLESRTGLISVNFLSLIPIYDSGFMSCSQLRSIIAPHLNSIGPEAFKNCPSLSELHLVSLATVNSNDFQGLAAFSAVWFPLCTPVGDRPFANCISLEFVSLLFKPPHHSLMVFESTGSSFQRTWWDTQPDGRMEAKSTQY